VAVACGWTAGCRPQSPWRGPAAAKETASPMAAEHDQQQVALAARDAMFGRLLRKLMEVLGESGPVAAIEVCRQQPLRSQPRPGRNSALRSAGRRSVCEILPIQRPNGSAAC